LWQQRVDDEAAALAAERAFQDAEKALLIESQSDFTNRRYSALVLIASGISILAMLAVVLLFTSASRRVRKPGNLTSTDPSLDCAVTSLREEQWQEQERLVQLEETLKKRRIEVEIEAGVVARQEAMLQQRREGSSRTMEMLVQTEELLLRQEEASRAVEAILRSQLDAMVSKLDLLSEELAVTIAEFEAKEVDYLAQIEATKSFPTTDRADDGHELPMEAHEVVPEHVADLQSRVEELRAQVVELKAAQAAASKVSGSLREDLNNTDPSFVVVRSSDDEVGGDEGGREDIGVDDGADGLVGESSRRALVTSLEDHGVQGTWKGQSAHRSDAVARTGGDEEEMAVGDALEDDVGSRGRSSGSVAGSNGGSGSGGDGGGESVDGDGTEIALAESLARENEELKRIVNELAAKNASLIEETGAGEALAEASRDYHRMMAATEVPFTHLLF
jgi:hypothetical protein